MADIGNKPITHMDHHHRTVGSCDMALGAPAHYVDDLGDAALHPLLGTYGSIDVVDIYGLHDGVYSLDILYHGRHIPRDEHHWLCHPHRPLAHRKHPAYGIGGPYHRYGGEHLPALGDIILGYQFRWRTYLRSPYSVRHTEDKVDGSQLWRSGRYGP